MKLFRKYKLRFIKLIVSIIILMVVFSQIENTLSLNAIFAAETSFTIDGVEFYYDPDSEENCLYIYNSDKTERIRCTLQTYAGQQVYYPENFQTTYLLTIYTKDKNGNFSNSTQLDQSRALTYMGFDGGYLSSFLGAGITEKQVSEATGIDTSNKDTNNKNIKEDDSNSKDTETVVDDIDKVSKDYAKYSYDSSKDILTVQYYNPNTQKVVTKNYSYNESTKTFTMNNPEGSNGQAYYSDYINSDEHNALHPVMIEIAVDDIESVTGISKDDLDSYMTGEIDYNDDSVFEKVINGLAGFFLYPIKIVPLLLGKLLQAIMGIFTANNGTLSVEDILFNRIEITKIDFFNFSSTNEAVNSIRENVAAWYYGLRNISAVALLAVLMYVGLRMAISTISDEKAKYSQMAVNWVVSIALLFIMHLIIALVMTLNNQLVAVLEKGIGTPDPIDKIYNNAWNVGFVEGFGDAVCYLILVGMTFVFLLSYLKRMITIGFLIVISPLVTVTYSIDKMGDNKSQALNTWFKEFVYNILIQPFQCVSYIILASSAMKILDDEASLSAMLIAIMMILFIYESEKIIRHIFHFEARTMAETVSNAALVGTTVGVITRGGKNKTTTITSDTIDEKEKANLEEFSKFKASKSSVDNSEYNNEENYTTSKGKIASNNPHKRNSNVGRAISAVTNNRAFQAYANMAKTGSKMLLGGSLSLATGSNAAFLKNSKNIIDNGSRAGRNYIEERNKHELQQAYSNAENVARENLMNNLVMNQMKVSDLNNLDENQQKEANRIRENLEKTDGENITEQAKKFVALRADEIANGREPTTEAENEMKDAMDKLRTTYQNDGMDSRYSNLQISEDLANIRKGKYGESSHIEAKAKDIAKNAKEAGKIAKETGKIIATPVTAPVKKAKKFFRKK